MEEVKSAQIELDKLYEKVDNDLKNVATNLEKELQNVGKEVEDNIKDVGTNAEKEVEKVATNFLTKLFACLQTKTK